MAEIDPYPISALQDRYGLDSKQAVYDRINKLGIQPVARGKLSSEQLDILDKLHEHIRSGGAIADFAVGSRQREYTDNKVEKRDLDRGLQASGTVPSFPYPIVIQLLPAPDPLASYRLLDEAAQKGWALPTSTLLSLLGRKSLPRLTDGWFCRSGFMFLQTGRAGRELLWKVKKNQ